MSETIVAVDRALDVMLLLYSTGEEMGISEISRELALQKSTVHRTLSTLEEKGFVYKNKSIAILHIFTHLVSHDAT